MKSKEKIETVLDRVKAAWQNLNEENVDSVSERLKMDWQDIIAAREKERKVCVGLIAAATTERDALKEELAEAREVYEEAVSLVNAVACHSDMCEVCKTQAEGIMAKVRELEENHEHKGNS